MALITCENISLSYDLQPVIKNLSFLVSKGDYLCVVGENGAGKSTLIKGLLGLIKPSTGKISFSDGLVQSNIGYLPQQNEIQKDFPASVYEVVLSGTLNKCGIIPFYSKEQKNKANLNIKLLGLDDIRAKCYQDLSGGQQQRVLLARALSAADSLILLDEPVSGLDPLVTKDLYNLIKHLNEHHNLSVIMVSHDISGALENATHILHLEHDNFFYGTRNEYLKSDYVKKFLRHNGGNL